jgi:hypothetical protein
MQEPHPHLKYTSSSEVGDEPPGTAEKAFQINLDDSKYGAFAEIGAGQEVARWFFHVGGAAGTVAKTMSAYDMVVSDTIYGECSRYVSRERLTAMLDHEFNLLVQRLGEPRGADATFFVFANTVAAKAHRGPDVGHGWMGIRFQTSPRSAPSQIDLHVRMLDEENTAQQDALGIVGVNLIHGAFFHHEEPSDLLGALLDGLKPGRVEVDMAEFSGPVFSEVDHRLVSLQLVKLGLSQMTMFAPDGSILQPSERLYKRSVLVERGTFQVVTHAHLDMLERARKRFVELPSIEADRVELLVEMTMQTLEETGGASYDDFLLRADMLAAVGVTVLVSDYLEHYRLVQYLDRLNNQPIGLVTGVDTLRQVYQEEYYEGLRGGLLEGLGLLLGETVRMYIYPRLGADSDRLITAETMNLDPSLMPLHQYLLKNGRIESIEEVQHTFLQSYPEDVMAMRRAGDSSWEEMVPEDVVRVLKASDNYR